jgi:hypothetical protein
VPSQLGGRSLAPDMLRASYAIFRGDCKTVSREKSGQAVRTYFSLCLLSKLRSQYLQLYCRNRIVPPTISLGGVQDVAGVIVGGED